MTMKCFWMMAGVMAMAPLAGCATMGAPAGPAKEAGPAESITLETSPCFGACPVYSITVRADGTATFDGKRFTAQAGTKEITLKPGIFATLAGRLKAYRPKKGVAARIAPGEDCERMATDMPSYTLNWNGGPPAGASLYYYAGCMDDKHIPLRDTIRGLPETLGIEPLLRAQ
jgi:hypothetical protein